MAYISNKVFNPLDWYWYVGSDNTRLYSSAKESYVYLDDPAYLQWIGTIAHIPSEIELSEFLHKYDRLGPVVLPEQVNIERDRRVSIGCTFSGHLFQSRIEDQKRVNGAVTLALIALSQGAQPGNLRWHGGAEDFAWLAADNTLVTMDAPTVINFGKTVALWEAQHVFAARSLKDMSPIPRNFKDNIYWP